MISPWVPRAFARLGGTQALTLPTADVSQDLTLVSSVDLASILRCRPANSPGPLPSSSAMRNLAPTSRASSAGGCR